MITEKPHNNNWNFFIALEKTLEEVSRYIEFSDNNFGTYSIELARLLLAAGSEFDVVSKQLCELIDPDSNASNIINYRNVIVEQFEHLPDEKVYIPRYGLELDPLINWKEENKSPYWWRSYNNVKHERHKNYNEANLKNTLNTP